MSIILADKYDDALPVRRPDGGIIVDGQVVADTVMCVHCNSHFIPRKGSGIIRGYCKYCNGPICGPRCARCLPFEKYLELVEMGSNP
jgi:hypothetical protein